MDANVMLAALLAVAVQFSPVLAVLQSGPAVMDGTMSSFSSAIKGGTIYANAELEMFALYDSDPGFLTEQWFTGQLANDQTRIRIYIDNETTPSLDFDLFMAHGMGCGKADADKNTVPWQTRRIGKNAKGTVFNTYRIPFGSSVRVTATVAQTGAFWYIVRGVKNVPVTLGGFQLPANARLRLYKVQNTSLAPNEFVTMAATSTPTAGWLYQVTIHANSVDYTYLEACFRAIIDGGETQFLSSGTEDLFLSAYYFNEGLYFGDHSGLTCQVAPGEMSAYKFFEDDPILFSKSLKLLWRCGETSGGIEGCPLTFPADAANARYSRHPNSRRTESGENEVLGRETGLGSNPTVVSLYTWVYEY